MFKRIDKLLIDLPKPDHPDANAAAAVQELLGGRFGEMSTLNNYMYQSFNFRQKHKLRPFYELVASITAEEFGHVELVSNTINLMIEGTTFPGDPDITPMQDAKDKRNTYHFISTAQTSYPMDSMGASWRGDYVVNSGNLIFDLLHNYFLEIGARTHKMRVYEMTDHPVAREMIGYLLVRGGVHIIAYAKALEIATGVDLTKMLPVPNLSNRQFDYARKFEDQGVHRKLYTWSDMDYRTISQIWKGEHPTEGGPLEVVKGTPEGAPIPDLEELPEEFAPGISRDDFLEIAKRLKRNAGL
ncbi:manganese catalase family protein [Halalkalibacterium halodurans]|uniref:Mn catalase n=2 Tax=Halalkalibacterium halodurans TaxID=86665 RepID=Q9KDZ2_HALH5|nr:manganese catalase family protein [Halalkalibacterium halodurans]MDY7221602.1 manganese catalase family protein [Halalkalibacterium halodurans]MDY7240878.1 manganese catalase family protein [Halalkalibacterium halodurans]MED4079272.1 manganese catalase family protein [Halalkalibacterium halodurans]MED4085343.1 manganese catalase family protein [Halalkalibacterium halodurans]MED4105379.1 manganese catalase family protein [Halalkalibacterium halodurans]